MTPAYEENGVSIWQGDALSVLRQMPDESVNCCVTSPPYWGLRDYGTGTWEGGLPDCDHIEREIRTGKGLAALGERYRGGGHKQGEVRKIQFYGVCKKCGAVRVDRQIGLEASPEEWLEKLIAVFSEVRRVLRADGTLWLNIGDTYNGQGAREPNIQPNGDLSFRAGGRAIYVAGLKSKDLVGMPWMLAFALRADGWYLRQDIIWEKPNPMPESVRDRCTKAHEYIFLLSKSERYYYSFDAMKEPVTGTAHARGNGVNPKAQKMPDGRDIGPGGHGTFHRNGCEKGKTRPKQNESFSGAVNELVEYRNRRSVWTIPTEACPEAHFATFPTELVKPCILAGCPPGGIVLDPFGGSGTTGEVARALNCQAWLIELNPEYIEIAKRRLAQTVLSFGEPDEPEPSAAVQPTLAEVYGSITV